ncbi:MAG: ribosomal 30S subunit maturation factor RimM [Alphaproteobacteria bacterium]
MRLQFIDIELAKYLVKNKVPLCSVLDNMTLTPTACRVVPKGVAFKFTEVPDRNASEVLSKGDVTAPIELLPPVDKDSYTIDDFVGMRLQKINQEPFSIVEKADNYGASDIIECKLLEDTLDILKDTVFTAPLTPEIMIDIDFDNNIIIVSDVIDYYIT